MTKEYKILLTAFVLVNFITYLGMVIYNTSFALPDWNEATRAIFAGCLILSFLFVAWWVLFKD